MPDEPTAVVIAGTGRGQLLDALLGAAGPAPVVPAGTYLVVQPGSREGAWAYTPGARLPQRYDPAALARPPRRVELSLPDPLLRHFSMVCAPDLSTLDAAGTRLLLDVVRRGGALLHVRDGDLPLTAAERDLCARVADTDATLFLAAPDHAPEDPAGFAIGPDLSDIAHLRRALVEWAGIEALRRASDNPPIVPGAHGTVRVAAKAHELDWSERLERLCGSASHAVRQRLGIELANVHLRCVQGIVGAHHPGSARQGGAGLPDALDREMHALSLRAAAECDGAADRILDEMLTEVLGEIPAEGVRRRVAAAIRRDFAEQELARVLLITSTGGVASVAGAAAVASLAAYHSDAVRAVLPPLGVGLSGACYQYWSAPDRSDVSHARGWLQRALRGVELELLAEVSRRFDAVQRSLGALLTEAVDHGILLA
ncbi:hypothetical protein [Phytohabitans rumicis]|uniref:hypothetical protein n=1 Tax=Phytohabitans rumicis TaxID=1076125 RepID=UPI001565F69E|nr:hypothetical protein [Phytohabitans rumicis]